MSANIDIGISRASVGAHAKALLNQGMLIRDSAEGWHVANGYVANIEPKNITSIDITGECIRKMIEVK